MGGGMKIYDARKEEGKRWDCRLTGMEGGAPIEYTSLSPKDKEILEDIRKFAHNWIDNMKNRPDYEYQELRKEIWGNGIRNTIGVQYAKLHWEALALDKANKARRAGKRKIRKSEGPKVPETVMVAIKAL